MHPSAADAPAVAARLHSRHDPQIVLSLPGSDYLLHLAIDPRQADALPPIGKPVHGTLHARARRVDVVPAGGRYIEPVCGRPRRIQGRVVSVDPSANALHVRCAPACTLIATLTDPRQQPGHFAPGQLASFDIEPGATFHPREPIPFPI